jgi:glutamyl-tRNA reductase
LALDAHRLTEAINTFRQLYPAVELVVLSTCNRTELYIARPPLQQPSTDQVAAFLATLGSLDPAELANSLVVKENHDAVAHLFRVATGLESMVIGEPQVLGQVKRAYETANTHGTVGAVLHKVFQQAIGAAKRVRTETGIDAGRVSVGSAAVDFAKQIFERFDDKNVVGIGAGEMAKPMLQHFKQLAPAALWLTNRTPQRAQRLADSLGLAPPRGGARPFESLDDLLVSADIVLTSTGATEPIVTAQRFKPLLRRRRQRPLFLIDIAVPRDIDPAVGRFPNVYLYNIDDLQRVVEQTYTQRNEQALACEAKLADAVKACISEVQHRDVGQMIRALRQRLHSIGQAETQRTLRKLKAASYSPDDREALLATLIDQHTHRLINKIMHLPLSQLDHRSADTSLGFYAAALRRLFDLSDEALADEALGDDELNHDGADDDPAGSKSLSVDNTLNSSDTVTDTPPAQTDISITPKDKTDAPPVTSPTTHLAPRDHTRGPSRS